MPTDSFIADCVVIGGGAIGLSIAYRLAEEGHGVTLVERGEFGREASWAGAGILQEGSWYSDHPAMEALAQRACAAQREWSRRLLQETGIDDEHHRCGARYYETPENAGRLAATLSRWRARGIELTPVAPPANFQAAWRAPGESQVRNPRRLRALVEACRRRGVRLLNHTPVERIRAEGDRVQSVETTRGRLVAAEYVLAAGCWSPVLAEGVNRVLRGRPIRGQMLLLKPRTLCVEEIRHAYPYYLVPRRDGRVLVGATVEDVGFARGTTADARVALEDAAEQLAPGLLGDSELEGFWSGLRPRGEGELPTIGRSPLHANLLIATGHFRSGLQLSPPTAELIAALVRGEALGPWARAFEPRTRDSAHGIA